MTYRFPPLLVGRFLGNICKTMSQCRQGIRKLQPLITQFAEFFVRVPKAAPRRRDLAANGCHLTQEVDIG